MLWKFPTSNKHENLTKFVTSWGIFRTWLLQYLGKTSSKKFQLCEILLGYRYKGT